jgi:3-(3-hydroxy-phenyl)propionate hydroxylase
VSIRPVIIVGGGPTGLSAALFLLGQGIPVLVLEAGAEGAKDPRAATFHPPTLEMFAASGVTDELHRQGIKVPLWQTWDRTHGLVAEFDLGVLAQDTPFPYRLQCEQHKLVKILLERLSSEPGFEIRFGEPVIEVTQSEDLVEATTPGGAYAGSYLIGADGGRSVVRKSQEIGFEGFTYPERFLVITNTYDFEAEGYALSCYVADPDEWCALFKVPGEGPPGVWRVVFPTSPDQAEQDLLSFGQARRRLERFLPRPKPYEILHTNLYNVHQRVATTYRRDRVLLIGDAAHVNNPLGGMGMNFGIHDAKNLAEKLGRVIRGEAPSDLLDQYDRQRRSVASNFLQAMTIDNKRMLEEKDPQVASKRRDTLRRTASDPALARAHLLRTSMIEGLRASEAID